MDRRTDGQIDVPLYHHTHTRTPHAHMHTQTAMPTAIVLTITAQIVILLSAASTIVMTVILIDVIQLILTPTVKIGNGYTFIDSTTDCWTVAWTKLSGSEFDDVGGDGNERDKSDDYVWLNSTDFDKYHSSGVWSGLTNTDWLITGSFDRNKCFARFNTSRTSLLLLSVTPNRQLPPW